MPSRPLGFGAAALACLALAASPTPRAATPGSESQIANSDPIPTRNYQDLRWRNVGPTRGGRVTALAGVRSQPCTFYMGATGGGVWKTENCGSDWTPVTDGQLATGSIGSLDVSESNPNIVWAGTGSAAIRSNVIIGRGAYKSIDAGRTWRLMGLENAGQIGSVVIHPSNPDVVWIAALGSPYGPNPERGVFKTTDGGRTWRKTLFVNDHTGARVLAIDHANPDELYAGMYRGFRRGWDVISGGPASEGGIYKSTDGGETWSKLSAGLPNTLIGKIDLDVSRSNPSVVYAMIEAPGQEGGLYRSANAGASWTLVNNAANLRARPFYFNYVDVNPGNENEVWVSALSLFKSSDGGRTFGTVPTPHGDNHGIWFNPDNPSYFIESNDGGANVTVDGGRTWSSILNQPTGEFYMVTVDEQYPYLLYGPQQDNSTVVVPSIPPQSFGYDDPAQAFTEASGCETGGIMPSPDGRIIWGACKGELERFNVESGQSQGRWIYPQNRYGHSPNDITYRFPRQTVVYVSPHDPNVVYQASHVLHRTTDGGVTWTVISPDLTAHEPEYQVVPGTPITRDVTGEEVYSSIFAMDESPLERGVIWVGANDGPVHVTRDGGKTWKNVTPTDLPPGGRVQNIDASHIRRGSAYIAVYRYLREHDLHPYIYTTDDYGATWRKLTDGTNGIPADHPTRVVREDPEREGLLYAGTEFGFFVSFDNGGRWQPLQQNLPATPVTDVRVHRGDLVISTMGRGFWIMDDIGPLRQLAASMNARGSHGPHIGPIAGSTGHMAGAGVRVGLNPVQPSIDLSKAALLQPSTRIRYRTGRANRGAVAPQYPPVALALDYIVPEGSTGEFSIEITNAGGKVVRTMAARNRAGHNRMMWDYRWSDGGPLVAPGRYTVRLVTGNGAREQPRTFEVRVDPGVFKDGVTAADLVDQQNFLLKVRDTIRQATELRTRVQRTMDKTGVPLPPSPGPGQSVGAMAYPHPLQALWAKLVTAPGTYEQGMLIDQLSNIIRAESGADQKVGTESRRRLDDLVKALGALEAAFGEAAR